MIICAVGCGRSQESPDFLVLGQKFVEIVATGDSERIATLVVDSVTLRRALAFRSREPDVLKAAAGQLTLVANPAIQRDTARVFYRLSLANTMPEELALGFTRRGHQWLVYWMGLPEHQ
jgi:hypothetical protein